MGQLNLTPLENDDIATADLFNGKFAAIAAILNKGIDADNIKDGSITAALLANDMLNKQYPVGTIYWNGVTDTNPATLLGIGVWEPYAVGRGVVGFDASQTEFNAVGKTGGAKTVSLTGSQNGAHSHGISDPGHSHWLDAIVDNYGGGSVNNALTNYPGANLRITSKSSGGATTGIGIQSSGTGEAHENMPPYTVAYGWMRTA